MALYLRLLGIDPDRPKIPIHVFQAVLGLWAKGTITAAQAQAGMTKKSGVALSAGEVTELQTLVDSVPVGALLNADRALRLIHIDQCLLAADVGIAPLDTEAGLKAAIGGV